jgi:RNA recognition motif-containing protein
MNLESPPIHAVFLRNIAPSVIDASLQAMTEECGPPANIFNLASRRGIAFVTFFDSLDAERCVSGLESRVVNGQEVPTS